MGAFPGASRPLRGLQGPQGAPGASGVSRGLQGASGAPGVLRACRHKHCKKFLCGMARLDWATHYGGGGVGVRLGACLQGGVEGVFKGI